MEVALLTFIMVLTGLYIILTVLVQIIVQSIYALQVTVILSQCNPHQLITFKKIMSTYLTKKLNLLAKCRLKWLLKRWMYLLRHNISLLATEKMSWMGLHNGMQTNSTTIFHQNIQLMDVAMTLRCILFISLQKMEIASLLRQLSELFLIQPDTILLFLNRQLIWLIGFLTLNLLII